MIRIFIILIVLISCKTSLLTSNLCEDFEKDVKKDWTVPRDSAYPNVTDTLLYKLQNQYKDCMIGKDSGYVIGLFGRKYNLGLPGGKQLCSDSIKLKFSLEYPMKSPRYPFHNSDGYEMQLLIDSTSIVRCVKFYIVRAIGIE